MKIRIYYEDVDAGGICYHSKYLNFCERARSELFFSQGSSPIQGEYHFVVKHIDADFMASALFGDTVTVHTSVAEFKKASLIMFQEIVNQEGKLLFRMHVTLACMKGNRVSKILESYKAFLNPEHL
ncbi:MAG TPA: YbgC/FadM family acyl-CoA thioesterase [Sulfurovum sp.]|uniref:YbgC/FadM family acyl-CoA thioesterase n=1 Tax=Sulfurovum sp. TaxID=1969726 RepID=UPI002F9505A6